MTQTGPFRHSVPLQESSDPACAAMDHLIELGVLQPLDARVTAPEPKHGHPFKIPPDGKITSWLGGMASLGLPLADGLFGRETRSWIAWRETAFTIAGCGKYT
ncbi:MAG: hypothetical protein JJ992_05080, partial [Planctomycetes bacterium]|nr:hypothetical protein [Planctomycetota bacterium]